MDNFREFQAGPDPFGRTFHVWFKYLQTAISIRHSDSVDVCFLLESPDSQGNAERIEKTVVIQNADIRAYGKRTGRPVNDAWCSRLAMCKLRSVVETAEDIEKYYLPLPAREIEQYDGLIKKWEEGWAKKSAA
jgi:hypothetical protein